MEILLILVKIALGIGGLWLLAIIIGVAGVFVKAGIGFIRGLNSTGALSPILTIMFGFFMPILACGGLFAACLLLCR